MDIGKQQLTDTVNTIIKHCNSNNISDGYHTFGELYNHRIELFITLCRVMANFGKGESGYYNPIWRTVKHSDGTEYDGWFLLGINYEHGKQITYHLPIDKFNETNFAITIDKAPEFDGHSSMDVLDRLKTILK